MITVITGSTREVRKITAFAFIDYHHNYNRNVVLLHEFDNNSHAFIFMHPNWSVINKQYVDLATYNQYYMDIYITMENTTVPLPLVPHRIIRVTDIIAG